MFLCRSSGFHSQFRGDKQREGRRRPPSTLSIASPPDNSSGSPHTLQFRYSTTMDTVFGVSYNGGGAWSKGLFGIGAWECRGSVASCRGFVPVDDGRMKICIHRATCDFQLMFSYRDNKKWIVQRNQDSRNKRVSFVDSPSDRCSSCKPNCRHALTCRAVLTKLLTSPSYLIFL